MGRKKKQISITKYLPVLIILLSITIIVGSTFAYFTDRKDTSSNLTFSKVELSSETALGINGALHDVIPGTRLVDGAVQFSKAIDSEAIYVRAKISFSLPDAYNGDAGMIALLDGLRSSTDFNIESGEQTGGAVWSEKQGNYFYLVTSADTAKLMRVDTIDTYTLSTEIVVPRDLECLEDNAQYMKSVNFHIAFEAIQADNVSDTLADTKAVFNELFPQNVNEEYVPTFKFTLMGADKTTQFGVVEVENGALTVEPEYIVNKDENETDTELFKGWYTDEQLTNKYEFGNVLTENVTLYPKVLQVSEGLAFDEVKSGSVLKGYGVKQGSCTDTTIVVPENYLGKPVISVIDFRGNNDLINIILPETITRIDDWSMAECSNLGLIELPNAITSIDDSAFYYCFALQLESLPNSLTNISRQAFLHCRELTLTELPSGLKSVGDNGFSGCTKLAITELPSGLTKINSYSFMSCPNIRITQLPSGVTSIGTNAFMGSSNVALTSLPDGLKTISLQAFYGCTSLAINELPNSVTSIGSSAFAECPIPDNGYVHYLNFKGTNEYYIDRAVNTSITTVVWPGDIRIIAGKAFSGCSALNLDSIPSGITQIGEYTFNGCSSLTLTELPDSVTKIGDLAFYGCTNLALTKLPSQLTSVGSSVFMDCTSLAITELPSGLIKLGWNNFVGCTAIKSLKIGSTVTSSAGNAFNRTTCYLLCANETVAGIVKTNGNTNIYVLSSDDLSTMVYTDVTDSGDVVGSYNDGTNTYLKVSNGDGTYSYYVNYAA